MLEEFLKIAAFILKSIIHVWPYLLLSVPIAVSVKMSGASKYIGKVFNKKPLLSILLATMIGAFSPFCSCSVIPVIASLLIGGVPLAPVMSFWLASPSMDPEIFLLSVSVLGWQLAIWRIASAFGMSFFSGLITHYLVKKGWITEYDTLKAHSYSSSKSNWLKLKGRLISFKEKYLSIEKYLVFADDIKPVADKCLCFDSTRLKVNSVIIRKDLNSCCNLNSIKDEGIMRKDQCCSVDNKIINNSDYNCCTDKDREKRKSLFGNLLKETIQATLMVVKFMILAYFLEALIVLYIPGQFITMILGQNHILSIILASIIGVPVYTSSMPALALVAGLISKGMIPAAGLSFLISGPTTTIPAMAAVWNLANRKVFILYVGFTLAFAIISGFLLYASSLFI